MRFVVVVVVLVLGIRQLFSFYGLFRHLFGFSSCEIHSQNGFTSLYVILV